MNPSAVIDLLQWECKPKNKVDDCNTIAGVSFYLIEDLQCTQCFKHIFPISYFVFKYAEKVWVPYGSSNIAWNSEELSYQR